MEFFTKYLLFLDNNDILIKNTSENKNNECTNYFI